MVAATSSIMIYVKKSETTKQDTKRLCNCPTSSLPSPGTYFATSASHRGVMEQTPAYKLQSLDIQYLLPPITLYDRLTPSET